VHGDTSLGGPIWFILQFLMLATLALAGYVFVDSLRASRRADAAERLPEPSWIYTVVSATFLLLTLAYFLDRQMRLGAAIVPLSAPVMIVVGFVYLLRVVYPKRHVEP